MLLYPNMPELPEVETVRRQLEPALVGKTLTSVDVLREKSWDGDIDEVIGAEIVAVKRKAKVLFVELRAKILEASKKRKQIQNKKSNTRNLSPKTLYLMVHLKMTGQLIYESATRSEVGNASLDPSISFHSTQDDTDLSTSQPINFLTNTRIVGGHPNNSWTNTLPDKHTRVVIGLSEGTLYFNDMRVFGWVKLVSKLEVEKLISSMPPDIIDDECNFEYFWNILQRSGRAVKLVILDHKKVGGIGNIYACDGLFDAGVDPRKSANKLKRSESDNLLESLKRVVNRGIELGGATAADGKFVNTEGLGGLYQEEFLVYEQEGEIRERDGKTGVVEKFKLGGRGTYWVRELQK